MKDNSNNYYCGHEHCCSDYMIKCNSCQYHSKKSSFFKPIEEHKIDNRPWTIECGGGGQCKWDDFGRCDAPHGICQP